MKPSLLVHCHKIVDFVTHVVFFLVLVGKNVYNRQDIIKALAAMNIIDRLLRDLAGKEASQIMLGGKHWCWHYWNTYLVGNEQARIISSVFGDICKSNVCVCVTDTAVLAPKNKDCLKINNDITDILPGHYTDYCSFDEVVSNDEHVAHHKAQPVRIQSVDE